MSGERDVKDFNAIIGNLLRFGVIISFTIILIGCILLFAENNTGYYTLTTAQELFARQNKFLVGFVPLIQGVIAGKPFAIIVLGLIVLLATPILRVAVSIFLFAAERRYILVGITATVLVILIVSTFVLGPLLA
ncbi:MAG: DUF1634 domain-containing protein [Nitrososphaerales archaeon]